jgi:basic amino acid/polyamine antiporter, APA family
MSVSSSTTDGVRGRPAAALGIGFAVAVTIGHAVGPAILRAPGIAADYLPSFWPFILVWLVGGLYALLGANALAELATMTPRSGGHYALVRRGLGEFPGFVTGWSEWLALCGSTALIAILIGEAVVAIFPEVRASGVVALGVIALFTVVQWTGLRAGAAAQIATALLKLAAILGFAAACLWLGSRSPAAPTLVSTDHEGSLLLASIPALQAVIYTYAGWSATIYFSGEFRDGPAVIPRALILSTVLLTVIYLLINLAFLTVVSLPTLARTPHAAAVVAERLFGPAASTILHGFVAVFLLSAVSATILMATRVLFSMSGDSLFWRGAREVNGGGTPDVALLISSIVSAAFVVAGSFESVITTLAVFVVANHALTFLSLFVLRRTGRDLPRPWRAWGHPWTTGLVLAASLVFLGGVLVADAHSAITAVAVLLASVPLYLLMRRLRTGYLG